MTSCDVIHNGFAETNLYAPGPNGKQLEESDGNFNPLHFNFFLNGSVLATYAGSGDQQSNWHYSLNDWVGTRRVQANVEGTNLEETVEGSFQTMPFGDNLTTTGAPGATEEEFTGKERDAETGNDYFPARYYASSAGRFLTPDWSADPVPVPYASLSNPQSLNLFSYVTNNPLSMVDELGHGQAAGESKPSCTFAHYSAVNNNCMEVGRVLGALDEFDVLRMAITPTGTINVPGRSENGDSLTPGYSFSVYGNASIISLVGAGPQLRAPNNGNQKPKGCSVLDPNCKPPSYGQFLECMAAIAPMNLFGGETDTKAGSFGGLALVAATKWKAPVGGIALTLDSISFLSAERDANVTCSKIVYGIQ